VQAQPLLRSVANTAVINIGGKHSRYQHRWQTQPLSTSVANTAVINIGGKHSRYQRQAITKMADSHCLMA